MSDHKAEDPGWSGCLGMLVWAVVVSLLYYGLARTFDRINRLEEISAAREEISAAQQDVIETLEGALR